nr:Protein LSD1 [Ipomoea batatas]
MDNGETSSKVAMPYNHALARFSLKHVLHAAMEMAQLICGGCRTLLMHPRGATSVRCSCCHTVNLVPDMHLKYSGSHVGFFTSTM